MLQHRVRKYTLQNQTKFSRLIKSLQNRPSHPKCLRRQALRQTQRRGLWANKGHQRADTLYIYIMLCCYMHALVISSATFVTGRGGSKAWAMAVAA